MDATDPMEDMRPIFVGMCVWFRTLPRFLIGVSIVLLALGNVVGALVLGAGALVMGAALPWRFAVFDEGVNLWFALRQDRFFSKHDVRVRAGAGGAVLYPSGRGRFGYSLSDGLVERRRDFLRALLLQHHFRVVED